jgi:soluble lytic murein transglycosylase-like protein
MSILSAIKQQNSSIDDLAALPQAMIMQMAQKKQISEEMLAPILSRKAELAEAFARQNALKNSGQTPPTVMEQLMAQNAQAEQPQMPQQAPQMAPQMPPQEMPQDMGVAQLPIPERQYAGGGIVAFADGGLSDSDDDYEDSLEEADYNAMIERAMNAGEDESVPTYDNIPVFETRQSKGSPQSFPNTARDVGIASGRDDMDARLRSVIMQKESGGRRYDKSGNLLTSSKGALGEMQVMPATARDPGFGIKPAQSDDPNELKRVGDEYASVLLRRYKDPMLAMIAYNMGPGATDKWLAAGADPRRLPKETQGYIRGVNLAQGGEVKHYAGGGGTMSGFEDGYSDIRGSSSPEIDEYVIDPMTGERSYSGYGRKKTAAAKKPDETKKPVADTPTTIPMAGFTPDEMIAGSTRAGTFDALMNDQTTGRAIPEKAEAPKTPFEAYMAKMLAREEGMDKQRAEDRNMALLTAGLGMLGGTSQYAAENIGKGALAGVQNLSESKKQRIAEQAALDKSMLYATRYQGAEDLAKQNAAYNRAMRERQYALDVKKQGTEEQKIAINQYETHLNNAIKSLDKNPLLTADPAARAAAEDKIINSPQARALRQRAYGDMPMDSPSSVTLTPKRESLLSKYLPK